MEKSLLQVTHIGPERPAKKAGFAIKTIKFIDLVTQKEHISIIRSSVPQWNFEFKIDQVWIVELHLVKDEVSEKESKNLVLPDALHSSIFKNDEKNLKQPSERMPFIDSSIKDGRVIFRFGSKERLLYLKRLNIKGEYECIHIQDYLTKAFECETCILKDREIAEKYFINLKQLH